MMDTFQSFLFTEGQKNNGNCLFSVQGEEFYCMKANFMTLIFAAVQHLILSELSPPSLV